MTQTSDGVHLAEQAIYLADHTLLLALPALIPAVIVAVVVIVIAVRDRRKGPDADENSMDSSDGDTAR
jgi:hypothetical protein